VLAVSALPATQDITGDRQLAQAVAGRGECDRRRFRCRSRCRSARWSCRRWGDTTRMLSAGTLTARGFRMSCAPAGSGQGAVSGRARSGIWSQSGIRMR
jgi:hypothetical protein